MPASVDLSERPYFPPVGNQYNVGNCTSWASTYYQFSYEVARKFDLDVNYESNLFSPRWVHNIAKNGEGNLGNSYNSVYNVLSNAGAVRLSEFAPTENFVSDTSTEYLPWHLDLEDMTAALKYRVSSAEKLRFSGVAIRIPITSYNSSALLQMKTFLSAGKVLTVVSDVTDWDFQVLSGQTDTELNGKKVCLKHVADERNATHAMTIVGYNDNITYDMNNDGVIQDYERGAFKFVNSHGESWGDSGFAWVMYDALNSLSNASNQNVSNRKALIYSYEYNVIEVEEYPRDLIAKVTLSHNDRTQVKAVLGTSDLLDDIPTEYAATMLLQNKLSESVNFSGTGTSTEEKTFVFDFGDLFNLNTERKNCYISIFDEIGGNPVVVKNIELIDGTGKTIASNTMNEIINGSIVDYKYKLGVLGDVNNDAKITSQDATSIQKYLSGLIEFSADEMKIADTNGDGNVTANDSTLIQKYLADIITEFPNGSIVLLS